MASISGFAAARPVFAKIYPPVASFTPHMVQLIGMHICFPDLDLPRIWRFGCIISVFRPQVWLIPIKPRTGKT